MTEEAVTDVKDTPAAPVEADNSAPPALATPNLIEPMADEPVKVEPVTPPVKPRPSEPLIGELSTQRQRRREAEERAAQIAKENENLRMMVERLSKGQTEGQAAQFHVPPNQPSLDAAAIERAAEYKLFLRDVEGLIARGSAQYGENEFTETRRTLAAVGADDNAFVHSVMAVAGDKSHELLQELSQNTDKALALVRMRPEYRIAELTRMTMKATQAAPAAAEAPKPALASKGVSKAPAPAPALNSSTSKTVDWRSDAASDEEFDRGYRETMAKRRGGRF